MKEVRIGLNGIQLDRMAGPNTVEVKRSG